jgi:hypothetical protein
VNRASIVSILSAACDDVVRQLARVPLPHWNESVFRFLIVRRLRADKPNIRCETEWHRIDLVLFDPQGATLLELKFFSAMPLVDHAGRVLRTKGSPGKKNYREYQDVIKKLRTIRHRKWITDCGRVASAHLLLAYSDSFESYYDGIAESDAIARVSPILKRTPVGQDSNLTCKLITVRI